MGRREWVGLTIVALELAAAASCSVDGYLTCGAACDDASSPPVDATLPDTGNNGYEGGYEGGNYKDSGYYKDSSYDGSQQQQDSGSDASDGNCTSQYCQGSSSCCSAAPICNSGNHCAASCGAIDASCTTQGGDSCCKQTWCNSGHCAQCLPNEAGCSNDNQCCSGNCSNSNFCF